MATINGAFVSADEERLLTSAADALPDDWRIFLSRGRSTIEIAVMDAQRRRVGYAMMDAPATERLVTFLDHLRRAHETARVD